MKSEFTLERFKRTFDAEGNEVLTPVPFEDGSLQRTQANEISVALNWFRNADSSFNGLPSTSTWGNNVFNNYHIYVTHLKLRSRTFQAFESATMTTTDTAYSGNDRVIAGARFAGQDAAILTKGDPYIQTMKCRYEPRSDGTDRTINTIYVGNFKRETSWVTNRNALNCLLLDTPCIQKGDEVLIITYRFVTYLKELAQSLPCYDAQPDWAENFANVYNTAPWSSYDRVLSMPTHYVLHSGLDVSGKRVPITRLAYMVSLSGVSHNHSEGSAKLTFSLGANASIGKAIHSMSVYPSDGKLGGEVVYPLHHIKFREANESCIQNTYLRAPSTNPNVNIHSDVPFYDVNSSAASLGKHIVSDPTGAEDTLYVKKGNLTELIRTEITQGGSVGNSRYKVATRLISALSSPNNYTQITSSPMIAGDAYLINDAPYTNKDRSSTTLGGVKYLGHQAAAGHIKGNTPGNLAVYYPGMKDDPRTGIWIHSTDLGNHDFPCKLDSTTVAGFAATDVRDFASAEDGTILVACAETGLWKLTRNHDQVASATVASRITIAGVADDTKCYAVIFRNYGGRFASTRIVALFADSIVESNDGGDTWTVNNTTSTHKIDVAALVTNIDKVIGISASPHNDEEYCIIESNDVYRLDDPNPPSTNTTQVFYRFWYKLDSTAAPVVSNYAPYVYVSSNWSKISYGSGASSAVPIKSTNYTWLVFTANPVPQFLAVPTKNNNGVGATSIANSDVYTIPTVYDSVNDKDLILWFARSNRGNLLSRVTYLEDADAIITGSVPSNSTRVHYIPYPSVSSFTIIARGMMLVVGLDDRSEVDRTAYQNFYGTDSTHAARFGRLIGISKSKSGDLEVGKEDYYVGNPYNFWYEYGWDGSKWVLDSTGDKATHIADNPFILGLTNKFQEDVNSVGDAGNYVVGEFYDTYVCDGVFKDDYTSVAINTMIFNAPTKVGNTFTPSTVPANGAGNVKQPLGVRYAYDQLIPGKQNIVFESDYIGCAPYQSYGTPNDNKAANFLLLGMPITGDFELEFQVGHSLLARSSFTNTQTSGYPTFGVAKVRDTESLHPPIYSGIAEYCETVGQGFGLGFTTNYQSSFNVVKHYDTEGFNIKTDSIKMVREGNALIYYMKDVEVYRADISALGDTIQIVYQGYGLNLNSATQYVSGSLAIYNPMITFNDTYSKVKVGDSVAKTGAFDANFGKLTISEYEVGTRKIFLDGVEATVINDDYDTVPAQGEVRIIRGSGEIVFNPADAGKTVTGTWRTLALTNAKEY